MNPVVAAIAAEEGVSAVKGAGKSVKSTASRVNADTGGALSWVLLAGVAVGFFALWQMSKPFRTITSTVGDAIEGISNLFTRDYKGIGKLNNLVDPAYRPQGATINVTQAQTIAAQLFALFDSLGTLNASEKGQVYGLFINKTPVDVQLIDAAFGMPRRNALTGREGSAGTPLSLSQWLGVEMGAEGMNYLRTITHGIF